jgi:putative membrane protein
MKETLSLMFKGFFIGSSMSVPGVSGGTMAILLGIYDRLISSISNFFKDIKGNFFYLAKFSLGALIGFGSLAFLIEWLLEKYPLPVSFFFLGAVIGGIPALYKKTKESAIHFSSFVFFLLGLTIVIAIGFLPIGIFDFSSGSLLNRILLLLVSGIIISIALILPGISTSHMLLVLGMYDTMLAAITEFNIVYLGVLGFSVLFGVILTTKPLEWTMNTHPHKTYCVIIGFVLGSTSEIFRYKIAPSIPETATMGWWIPSIVISMITFALGIMFIQYLSKYSND